MLEEIKKVEKDFELFTQNLGRLQGEFSLLEDIQNKSGKMIEKNKEDQITYVEAVELLSIVQKVTRDKIKTSFEGIASNAINYIFNSDEYSFHLDFSRRGNLGELDFSVQTPDKPEALDILKTDAGGIKNVVSIALRIILMQVSSPKIEGLIIFDESFANLSSEYQPRASMFLRKITEKFKRQIVMITHSNEFIDESDYNKIEIT